MILKILQIFHGPNKWSIWYEGNSQFALNEAKDSPPQSQERKLKRVDNYVGTGDSNSSLFAHMGGKKKEAIKCFTAFSCLKIKNVKPKSKIETSLNASQA